MASIREVAKLAGVSPSTVSRVMNGTANVSDEKKQRVLAAIDETGFTPNELARALYKKSSRIIGVLVPNIENPFFNELARAIEEESYRNGYKILLCNSNNNAEKELMNIQMLNRMKADGIIVVTHSDKTGRKIAKCDLPVVVLDRRLDVQGEIAYVEANHYIGGRMATEHLLRCGCKNIVLLRGPLEYSSGQQRYLGYQDVCREHDIQEQCIDCIYDYEAGLEATQKLLEQYPEVDGIIACNDMVAISAYKTLCKQGRRVPEDIQIIGFDNIRFSWLFMPELTTIRQPITEMGTLAVQLIMKYCEHQTFPRENILDVELIERQTTKPIVYENI